MVNTPRSTQPFILLKLIKWVRGTPGNWVVKKMSNHWLSEENEGIPAVPQKLDYHPLLPLCFSRKYWVCSFHAVFDHISQNVSTPSLIVNTKCKILDLELLLIPWIRSSLFLGYHKILESIVMLFLLRNKC